MTLILPHWTIYHRQSLGTNWTDISDKVNYKGLEWSDKLSDKVSFSVPIVFSKTDTILDIQPGDFIAICKDSTKYDIADSILVGIVDNPNKEIAGLDYTNSTTTPYKVTYSLQCTGWDYSRANITSYEYSQQSISSIIAAILEADSQELLGGVINGVTISKYSLKCPSFTVDSFKAIEKTAYEAIDQLCNENKLYYKLIWYSSPNTTTGLNLAAQILIFDDTGLQPKEAFWNDTGITDASLKDGQTVNPAYNALTNPNVAQYFPTIKKPKIREDQSNIRNYLVFDGHYSEAGAFDNDLADLERYETTAQGVNNDTYYLPHPAFDIYSGGFLVSGYVTAETVPSTTQFSINSGLSGSVVIGDKIVINKGTDIRTVSGVSGNLITLSTALPSAPITNDLFEVIQQDWITIYDENENTAVYSSRGFAKDLKLDQQAKIRWLADRSVPPPGTILVYYYWPAKPYKRVVKVDASIAKYGLKRSDIKSDTIMTKTQIDALIASFENQTPNKTLELSCYLPTLAGDMISVNITDFCTDKLMVNEVRGKYGGVKKYHLINSYEISLSNNYKEDFNDLLSRLTTKANFKNSGSENKLNKIVERISVTESFQATFTSNPSLYTEKLVYTKSVSGQLKIFMCNLDGTNEIQLTNGGSDNCPRLYKNYLTFLRSVSGRYQVHRMNLATSTITQVTSDLYTKSNCSEIDSDFDTVYYSDGRDGSSNIELFKKVISTGVETRLTTTAANIYNYWPHIVEGDSNVYYSTVKNSSVAYNYINAIPKAGGTINQIIGATTVTQRFIRPVVNYQLSQIVYDSNEYAGGLELKICNIDGSSPTRLTNASGSNFAGRWNAAGTEVYFLSTRDTTTRIYKINVSTGTETQITGDIFADQSFGLGTVL